MYINKKKCLRWGWNSRPPCQQLDSLMTLIGLRLHLMEKAWESKIDLLVPTVCTVFGFGL